MNTPTKRIFYLFEPKVAKNYSFVADYTGCVAGCATSWPTALLDAGLLLGALDSSHLLLGKPDRTVIFSVVRCGATKLA